MLDELASEYGGAVPYLLEKLPSLAELGALLRVAAERRHRRILESLPLFIFPHVAAEQRRTLLRQLEQSAGLNRPSEAHLKKAREIEDAIERGELANGGHP